MAATVTNNVGYIKGYYGTGIIYLGKTSGGVEFLSVRMADSTDKAVLGTFKFLPRSSVLGAIGSGDAVLVSTVNISLMPETAPDGLLDASGDIDFGATALANYPRIYENQAFYSVVSQENKPTDYSLITQANVSGGSVQYVASTTASTTGFNLSTVTDFLKKNALWILGGALLVQITGIYDFTPLFSGKKKSRRRR